MGFQTSSTKSKRYRGPTGSLASKGSLTISATSIVKRKISDMIQQTTRGQRRLLVIHLHVMRLINSSIELSPAELAAIQTLRDPPGPEDDDWEMSDGVLGDAPL